MPEPTAAIQVLPQGLLGFLQLKNGGQYPQTLGSDKLQACLELFDWYTQTNIEYVEQAGLALAVGANTTTVGPPTSQVWYVHDISVASQPGAGAQVDLSAAVQFFPSPSNAFQVGQYVNATANQNIRAKSDRSFFLLPGGLLAVMVRSITLAPTATVFARITRCFY